MGQRANSGRNANLDEKRERMEGRKQQKSPEASRIREGIGGEVFAKGKTAGATGRGNRANRGRSSGTGEGGGGGGANRPSRASAATDVGRSTRPAR